MTKKIEWQGLGINFDKERNNWYSRIQISRKRYALGRYDTPDEAQQVYDCAKKADELQVLAWYHAPIKLRGNLVDFVSGHFDEDDSGQIYKFFKDDKLVILKEKEYTKEFSRPIRTKLELAQSSYFTQKKQNVKITRHEWNLEFDDIVWNTTCPVLGLEIDWLGNGKTENSPSLDRIDSNRGYIRGNVCLISWRANRIKNDGSMEEHLKIAKYMENSQ